MSSVEEGDETEGSVDESMAANNDNESGSGSGSESSSDDAGDNGDGTENDSQGGESDGDMNDGGSDSDTGREDSEDNDSSDDSDDSDKDDASQHDREDGDDGGGDDDESSEDESEDESEDGDEQTTEAEVAAESTSTPGVAAPKVGGKPLSMLAKTKDEAKNTFEKSDDDSDGESDSSTSSETGGEGRQGNEDKSSSASSSSKSSSSGDSSSDEDITASAPRSEKAPQSTVSVAADENDSSSEVVAEVEIVAQTAEDDDDESDGEEGGSDDDSATTPVVAVEVASAEEASLASDGGGAVEAVAVVAQVVEEDDEAEAEAEAVPQPTKHSKRKRTKTNRFEIEGSAPSQKKGSAKRAKTQSPTKASNGKKSGTKSGPKTSAKSSTKSSKKKTSLSASSSAKKLDSSQRKKIKAASAARQLLSDVAALPVNVQGIVVHEFGIIVVDPPPPPEDIAAVAGGNEVVKIFEDKYSSARAIHPVGFECDRYENSPVHNRVIKVRCEIVQGSKGPLFKIAFGKGVEEDNSDKSMGTKDFDIEDSTPVMLDAEKDAEQNDVHEDSKTRVPECGMRVKVRFDQKDWYHGSIVSAKKKKNSISKKSVSGASDRQQQWTLHIRYDDGQVEEETYPDVDIVLCPEREQQKQKRDASPFQKQNSAPPTSTEDNVTTVYGHSPLEAWGKVLIHLGLIDEIMMEHAFESLADSRKKTLVEAGERVKAQKIQRQQARARERQRKKEKGGTSEAADDAADHVGGAEEASGAEVDGPQSTKQDGEPRVTANGVGPESIGSEDAAKKEAQLRSKIEELRHSFDALQKKAQSTKNDLANARLSSIGPFLCNPFQHVTRAQQSNWLSTVIRKEKSKMGSTGNKRKIINSTDLLNRMDTFFNPEIEGLVEGLPGSELCPTYVFRSCRGTGGQAATQAWVHEAHIKAEKEKDRQRKLAKEAKLKKSQWLEKEQKRKEREHQLEKRKQEKEKVEEKKKLKREEERLARLKVQVDDRLFKEACFQREKVVLLGQKGVVKENGRRRKAAETLAAHLVEQGIAKGETYALNEEREDGSMLKAFRSELPPLSKRYDINVLRVWDFVHSFSSVFSKFPAGDNVFATSTNTAANQSLPSLDDFQEAIDYLRRTEVGSDPGSAAINEKKKEESIELLTKMVILICKPLASRLKKTLSIAATAPSSTTPATQQPTSTVAANPSASTAAPFGDESTSQKNSKGSHQQLCEFPVNKFTWKEVARLALVSDALTELGLSKQDCANTLRGYRSGGHPNSKEARRLRRGEDSSLVMLRQILADQPKTLLQCLSPRERKISSPSTTASGALVPASDDFDSVKVRVPVPCVPTALPTDWEFYLHNIKAITSSSSGAASAIKSNLQKSLALLKDASDDMEIKDRDQILSELQKSLSLIEHVADYSSSEGGSGVCGKARQICLRVLDRATGELFSQDTATRPFQIDMSKLRNAQQSHTAKSDLDSALKKPPVHKLPRQRMGMLSLVRMSKADYNKLANAREEYMAVAMKKQRKREHLAQKKEAGEEDDEDDEDDEDEDEDDENDDTKTETDSQSQASGEEKKVAAGPDEKENDGRIGKATPYDDFCADDPKFPELIRRCLAVLRTLCMSPPGETFIYPVDPQANPRYYETVLTPMCLQDVGIMLQKAGTRLASEELSSVAEVEEIVAKFARNIRAIGDNCTCYSAVGSALISNAEQLIRIFERLLLDWVLCPDHLALPLEDLDDDKCVEPHPSDIEAMVLICDGCEGKFNMTRLEPPLHEVPQGDWYCPRCVSGRCWAHLDPRIGCKVSKSFQTTDPSVDSGTSPSSSHPFSATIKSVFSVVPEANNQHISSASSKASLLYVVRYDKDHDEEYWTVDQVDAALKETAQLDVPPIRCLEAVAESPGYGDGGDYGVVGELLPPLINPSISDAAAQAMLSSTVFEDVIRGVVTLVLSTPQELNADEWLQLLTLLSVKCTACDEIADEASRLENAAAEKLAKQVSEISQIKSVEQILPKVSDDEEEEDEEDASSMVAEEGGKEASAEDSGEKKRCISSSTTSPKQSPQQHDKSKDRKRNRKLVLFGDEETSEGEHEGDDESDEVYGSNKKRRTGEDASTSGSSEAEWMDDEGSKKSSRANKVARKSKRKAEESSPSHPKASTSDKGGNDSGQALIVKVNVGNKQSQSPDGVNVQAKEQPVNAEQVAVTSNDNSPSSAPPLSTSPVPVPDIIVSKEDMWKQDRASALTAKAERTRAREDGFVGHAIRKLMRPTVASLEEDAFSQVVDSVLASHDEGLSLGSCLCPTKKCDFCGLPDEALGTSLVRVPNRKEWMELLPHGAGHRVARLIAQLPHDDSDHVDGSHNERPEFSEGNEVATATSSSSLKADNADKGSKMISVTLRVGGKLISDEPRKELFDSIPEYGMLEFMPRNAAGFQDELHFRNSSVLPFATGSLSAHECCAVAVHNARKEKMLQAHRDHGEKVAELDFARLCGRTPPVGVDKVGRSYWIFHADLTILFVRDASTGDSASHSSHGFSQPEAIASVIVCLGNDDLADELKRLFPKAAEMVRRGNWAQLLQRRRFDIKDVGDVSDDEVDVDAGEDRGDAKQADPDGRKVISPTQDQEEGGDGKQKQTEVESNRPDQVPQSRDKVQGESGEGGIPPDLVPYEEGEDVLVESGSGLFLWDATVVAVSKDRTTGTVNGYRVHYKQWSSRFDEWVEALRVVEPTDHNLSVQEELFEEYLVAKDALPKGLDYLSAKNYIHSKKRARGSRPPRPLAKAMSVGPGATPDDEMMALLKAAVLTVEAALPQGSVDTSSSGNWKPKAAAYWRSMVEKSQGPASLMGCVVLLEDSIEENFLRPQAKSLLSSLPKHWKAISEASLSSIAMRVCLLDSGITYDVSGRSVSASGRGRRPRSS